MESKIYRTLQKVILIFLLVLITPMAGAQETEPFVISDATELQGLPHARRTNAGPVLMGMYTEGNISDSGASELVSRLVEEGITGIVSFHPPASNVTRALREAGIESFHSLHETRHEDYWNFHWWRNYDTNWTDHIVDFVNRHGPSHIAIHCQHGVDRTGNSMAFLLAVMFDVPIADAWYAVVNNRTTDLEGLATVLEEFGVHDSRYRSDPTVSLYTYNGSGMKVRSEGYMNYVRHVIQAALDHGASW